MTTPCQLPAPHTQSPRLSRAGRQPSSPRPLPRIPLLSHLEKRDFLTHSTTSFNRRNEIASRDSLFIAQNPRREKPPSSIIFRRFPLTLIDAKKYLQITRRATRAANSAHSAELARPIRHPQVRSNRRSPRFRISQQESPQTRRRYYGTPAEEGGSGKVYMLRAGLFKDVDVLLHWHPADRNNFFNGGTLADSSAKFTFHGVAASRCVRTGSRMLCS